MKKIIAQFKKFLMENFPDLTPNVYLAYNSYLEADELCIEFNGKYFTNAEDSIRLYKALRKFATQYPNLKYDKTETDDRENMYFQIEKNLNELEPHQVPSNPTVWLTYLRPDEDTGNFFYKGSNGKLYVSIDGKIHDTTAEREPLSPVYNTKIKVGEPVYNPADRSGREPGSKRQGDEEYSSVNEIVDINVIRDKATTKFAKRDIGILKKEGGMAITDTKYGVLWCEHSGGIFTFNVQEGIEVKNVFTGNEKEAFEFLKNCYTFEINENNKINKMNILKKEIRKILRENFLDAGANESHYFDDVNEIDVIDQNEPAGENPGVGGNAVAGSNITPSASPSPATEKKFKALTPEDQQTAIREIDKAKKTGKSNITFNIYASHKSLFIYFTDTLATLHNAPGVAEGEKENIRNVLWAIFYPSNPKIYRQLLTALSYAGAYMDSQSIEDIVVEGAMSALKYILGTRKSGEPVYNPMYSFSNTFLHYAKNRSIDIWKKQFKNKTIAKGMGDEENPLVSPEKKINFNQSIDQVYGDSGDDVDDALRLKDTLASHNDDGERAMKLSLAKKIWEPLIRYIERMLEKSQVSTKIFDYIVRDGIKLSKAIERKLRDENITNNKGKVPTETDINVYKKRIGEEILKRLRNHDIDKYISTVAKEPVDLSQLSKTILKRGNVFPLELLRFDDFMNLAIPIVSENKALENTELIIERNKTRVELLTKLLDTLQRNVSGKILSEYANMDLQKDNIKDLLRDAILKLIEIQNDCEELKSSALVLRTNFPQRSSELESIADSIISSIVHFPKRLHQLSNDISQMFNTQKYHETGT